MYYVHLSKLNRNKLEPRVVKCVFFGYDTNQKRYRCFDSVHNKMYTTIDYYFFDTSYFNHHIQSQGEYTSDDLSWFTYSVELVKDPSEQVGTPPQLSLIM